MAEKLSDRPLKTWCQLLPTVYDLLLENAGGVVDDTSLEKLLGWLEEVCQDEFEIQKLLAADTGTLNFLRHEQVFGCTKALAVALRLCGILSSKSDIFCFLLGNEKGSIVEDLFSKPRREPVVWSDGGVRDAYFTALQRFLGHEEGFSWLRNSGIELGVCAGSDQPICLRGDLN